MNHEEFVVVGGTDPEGSRPRLGALLGYHDPDGRLVYAGRVGTGIDHAELGRLWHRLQPLGVPSMPLDVPPPRSSRFGAPLVFSRVHWVRPELVAEVKYLTWTEDNLLRQVVYEGFARRQASVRGPPCGAVSEADRRKGLGKLNKGSPVEILTTPIAELPPPAGGARKRKSESGCD